MSKIIKNSSLSTKPKLIELTDIQELKHTITASLANYDSQSYSNEINALKAEGEQILKETEQMVFELLERAREEAAEIMLNAQEEADVIRQNVYNEAKLLREEARTTGYEEGLKKAQEEIESDRQRALEQNQLLIEEARQTKLAILRGVETDMVRLVIAVTKKVIANELSTNPKLIINIVRDAISYLDNPENLLVYVNPAELENLLQLMTDEALTEIGSKEIKVEVKGDSRVSCGGCLIESDNGSIDARIETKLDIIEQGLQEVSEDE